MRYLPAQVKEALNLSEETFRHWRRSLEPLRGRRGYAPCFSPGDLLALKVVTLLHSFGIHVKWIEPYAVRLFALCSSSAWFGLEDKSILFDGQTIELVTSEQAVKVPMQAQLVVPLAPLIKELRHSLLDEDVEPNQAELAFPPVSIAQGWTK